jgi:hypothetical protein
MIPLLFGAFLLASDTPAATAPAAQEAPTAVPAKKEKKVCKVDPSFTGSRMQKKICLTEAEWDKRNHSGMGTNGNMGRSYTAQ